MKKSRNRNNFMLSFFHELISTFKYACFGVFKILDFIINVIMTFISYLWLTFIFIMKYLGLFTVNVGRIVYKYGGIEIVNLFKALFLGIYQVLKILFYLVPSFIIKLLSRGVSTTAKKANHSYNNITNFFKNLPKTIKEYFEKKWNNLSLVKYYRNKKERELEILYVDKSGADAQRSEKKQVYKYLVKNQEGKIVKGYFGALSKLDVYSYLLDAGYEIYEIKTNWYLNFVHGKSKYIGNKMNNKDLIFWLTQLSTYIKSGIPLIESVRILARQDKKRKNKKVYDAIIYELSMGESFSESLKKQINVFPPLLINMIKAAELTGDLEGTLAEMSEYYGEKEKTRKQMISAMTYPSIVLIFALAIVTFMIIYIIPQFKDIYVGLNAPITGLTAFLFNASDFLKYNSLNLVIIIGIVILITIILYKKLKAFRMLLQLIIMKVPVIGKLIIYNEMTLFSKTFAVLNKNNILLTDSIDILSQITSNEFYKMLMYDTISNLLRGDKISTSFKNNWIVPSLAYYMITTGESTGELSLMLEKVSDYYQNEQRNLANTLKSLIEPILMVFLAVIVGGLMISILVPMYNVSSNILT